MIEPIRGQQVEAQDQALDGYGAINDIRIRTTRGAIVQVEDENHRPVAGAGLAALLPQGGVSGTFGDGGQTFYGTSGTNGQAKFRFRPNSIKGKFEIHLTASFQGRTVVASVAQTNAVGIAAVGVGLSVTAKILIIAGVAVAAGASAGFALTHGGGNAGTSTAASPSITIGSAGGPIVIGPPH